MGQSSRARVDARHGYMAWFCLMWHGGIAVEAGSLYVYTDAQGQAVLTDNVQQVPAEYRGRLRTVTSGEAPTAGVMASASEPAASSTLAHFECVAGDSSRCCSEGPSN